MESDMEICCFVISSLAGKQREVSWGGLNGKFGLDLGLDWPYNSPKMLIPPHKVQEICERFLAGEKKTEIARHMGISKFQVTAILAGKSRPEVGRPQEMSDPADKILEIHQAEIIDRKS